MPFADLTFRLGWSAAASSPGSAPAPPFMSPPNGSKASWLREARWRMISALASHVFDQSVPNAFNVVRYSSLPTPRDISRCFRASGRRPPHPCVHSPCRCFPIGRSAENPPVPRLSSLASNLVPDRGTETSGEATQPQLDMNRMEQSEFSRTAAATLPKKSVSPAGRPTPNTIKL